ncbi:unnamed protein product [Phyllotreta striolata]|uniref:Uncharacterized protein n=1 Tax=Phyllotreta striolata TaxID=444603 RepID=A0A9N9TXN1_PHYSR|nr:unnamed protein product [Phyllotreta striolata]
MAQMKWILGTFAAITIARIINCFPTQQVQRQPKNLAYLDYLQPEVDYNNLEIDPENYMSLNLDENPLSRTVPRRKQQFNSPIYYIRIPPQPYMFVPGLGYVSQPVTSPVSQFLNLPVPFVSNGKPNSIYQWSGAFQGFDKPAQDYSKPKPQKVKKPLKDSTVHQLPGAFGFNGKPEDIYVLRDSYNALYSDVLQNVYP